MNIPSETGNMLVELIAEAFDATDRVGKIIIARRVEAFVKDFLPLSRPAIPPALVPMTDIEAKNFGATFMLFGKHQGERVDSVPLDYLRWLADVSRDTWYDLHRYLRSSRIATEEES